MEILFRESLTEKEEIEAAKSAGFDITFSRNSTKSDIIIGRYSVLPFYRELEQDLLFNKSRLINSYQQHCYIANFDYYHDIVDYTPYTWFSLQELPPQGPFVVKGCTNSRKHQWNTHMYADTKKDAVLIATDLQRDSLIGQQNIIVRKYVPLEHVDDGINGLNMSNEWRFFFYKEKLLSYGYYWTSTDKLGCIDDAGIDFANSIAKIIGSKVNFFVIDIAKTVSGEWIAIEVNDGQMSGLSYNQPNILYENLYKEVFKETK